MLGQNISHRVLVVASGFLAIVLVLVVVVLPNSAKSLWAATHEVTLSGVIFDPNELTVDVGDTVKWNNVEGFHNVVPDVGNAVDINFTSGDPASSPWTFEFTFDTPGVFSYFCVIHLSAGMTGVITVQEATTTPVPTSTPEPTPTSTPVPTSTPEPTPTSAPEPTLISAPVAPPDVGDPNVPFLARVGVVVSVLLLISGGYLLVRKNPRITS